MSEPQLRAGEASQNDRPIGVFDSGIGGLTVVRQLMAHLPREHILYFGDSARVPYGTKSPETVTRFSIENTRFLVRREVKFVVVACNTASALALPVLQRRFEVPMIGVIEPGARAAVRATRNKRIGVVGTIGTIASGAYERLILALDAGCTVAEVACPLFVPLAEEGWTDGPVVEQVARIYLEPLLESGIDTLILGCTHYPLLKDVIARAVGRGVTLVDTAEETVRLVRQQLESLGLLRDDPGAGEGARRFFVSDIPAQFSQVGGRFLGTPIMQVEWVDQSDLPWFER
jgi:glutamate racemase